MAEGACDSSPPWSCNFIVMSAAGKPIYARHSSDTDIGRICAITQAIRSSIVSLASLGGDIRSLRSAKLCLVFMTVGSLTLVAIGNSTDTEIFLRLQLEYVYAQILFTVTDRALTLGFDLRSMLGEADANVIDAILDESSPLENPGPFLLGAVETLFPISPAIRARASRSLQATCLKTDFTAFAILAAGDKLITLIQPAFKDHRMRTADLQLLLKVISKQPHLLSSELWIPVCLPLFSSKDFLFCYTQCWDEASKLCLILVSQQSTTHQFQLFQEAAANIRRSLDLPPPESSVLEILDSHATSPISRDGHTADEILGTAGSCPRDVKWRRNEEDPNLGEDYETVSFGDLDAVLPYLPSSTRENDSVFMREVRAACCRERLQGHMDQYLAIGSALHFLFRVEVPLLAAEDGIGGFTQCVTSPLGFPFTDEAAKCRVWSTYQKLRLRLCLGSATVESTRQAWDEMSQEKGDTLRGTADDFSAMCLANAGTGNGERLTFVMDKSELYLAMKGNEYEL